MKEIGGYIELDKHDGSLYHSDAVALNSGRNALEYLILAKGIKKLFLPYYCCDSIAHPCRKCGIEYEYYHTDKNFRPIFSGRLMDDEWLYIINYYGQLGNNEIVSYKEKYDRIIIDNAQAFFYKPVSGIDTLYTCRKFFGVSDGAFLYTDKRLSGLSHDESFERIHFVLGRFERTGSEFYAEASANNDIFNNEPLKLMSRLTENILRSVDYKKAETRRTENFAYLHDHFQSINKLKLRVPSGAFMYPLYIDNGVLLRKKLQQNKIYIPMLWPDVPDICSPDEIEYNYAMNILPLPVDQRYTVNDMNYMIEVLEDLIDNKSTYN